MSRLSVLLVLPITVTLSKTVPFARVTLTFVAPDGTTCLLVTIYPELVRIIPVPAALWVVGWV